MWATEVAAALMAKGDHSPVFEVGFAEQLESYS